MARGGISTISINYREVEKNLNVVLSRVERGQKKVTVVAAQEIIEESLAEVPRDTNALASSAYYKVIGKYRNFSAEIGYGGNGDPINPRTGKPVSDYMVAVHEDLEAYHPIGKAKFLEDPVRRYQLKFGARAANILRSEIGL